MQTKVLVLLLPRMEEKIYLFTILKFKVVVVTQRSMTDRPSNMKWGKVKKAHVQIKLFRFNWVNI